MHKAYLRATVRNNPGHAAGIGIELFRLDAEEAVIEQAGDLSEGELEAVSADVPPGDQPTTAIMRIYEEIGEDFWTGGGITVKNFSDELKGLGDIKRLNIHINCLGGDAFTAQAIHSIVKDHPAAKTAYVDGVCASAATLIACAADEVIARHNTNYMIHKPWAITMGNEEAHIKAAEDLGKITVPIVSVYKEQVKDKISDEKIMELMSGETWMTADEALDYGFVDQIRGGIKAIAKVSATQIMCSGRVMNLSRYRYRNTPKFPYAQSPPKDQSPQTKKEAKEPMTITKEQLRTDHPEVFAAVQAEARETERNRLNALDAMTVPGIESIVAAAKADGRNPDQIAMECFNVMKTQSGQTAQLNALRKDAAVTSGVKAGDAPLVPAAADERTRASALVTKAFKTHKDRMINGKAN
jgi:ATP-dependent Clp protease protease subunit